MRMTGMRLARAAHGSWHGPAAEVVLGLSTDSRTLVTGEAFLALKGPHFDGHEHYAQAVAKGASALIGAENRVAGWDEAGVPVLVVDDTLMALAAIAEEWRRGFSARVIAITGSYGKTTVRSLLQHVLSRLGLRVAATLANNNNLVGVPKTLLAAGGDEDVVLVECGISEPGEMARLAAMVRPDVAVLTGIALAHTERLASVEGVVREKALLLQASRQWCALGEGVESLLRRYALIPAVDWFAADGPGGVRWRLEGDILSLLDGRETAVCTLRLPARHWAADAALVAGIVRRIRPAVTLADVAGALSDWQPPAGRMCPLGGPRGSHIYDDSYNANPASMAAALDTLRRLPGRRLAVLGDMLELGVASAQAHAGLDVSGLDRLVLVGTQMRALCRDHADAEWLPDAAAAARWVSGWQLTPDDHVLVKGSHGMGLDRVVRALTEGEHAL